jgi:hypothetical protein
MNEKKGRRGFLRLLVAAGAGIGLISTVKAQSLLEKKEKVRMLTPDGKIVEVEQSALKGATAAPASNQEVKDWMKTTPNNR